MPTSKTTTKSSTKKPTQKTYKKTVSTKSEPVKLSPSFLNIRNKTYDIIKKIVAFLPLLTALYITLAQVWGWGFGEQVDATVTAIISFLNGILGIFMVASSNAYHKGD